MGRITLSAISFIIFYSSVQASPIDFTVVLDPFRHIPAVLSVPDPDTCTTSGSHSTEIIKCDLQDAAFTMTQGSDIKYVTLLESTTITTRFEGSVYKEIYYRGTMPVLDQPLRVKIQLRTKDGEYSPGKLVINEDQAYTIFN